VRIDKTWLVSTLRQRWEVVALIVILCLSIPVVIWVPEAMVNRVYHGDRERSITSGNNYAKLVDDYRKTLVQIIGGAFLLYTLYLTQRRTKATEETLRVSQKTLKVTRETQVTDRFTKAITQLGAADSQGRKQLEIRFGGIYALERVARDSEHDHWPIMEILTAYVRENTRWVEPKDPPSEVLNPDEIPELAKDIQAIMTVIGRREHERDKGRLDLSGVDLRRALMSSANLSRADLSRANLSKADLSGAKLSGASLFGADLDGANLSGARLSDAKSLTQEQINSAQGDEVTRLPSGLTYPEHWPKAPNGQST
jgi:hypothetical protein